ncbi:MAG: sulfotransferase [Candidatus Cybelea sp.]
MPSSRAVLVLGMHRSGTSAIARGLGPLSVYLGNDFLDAQPENPTGYWEDKGIVAINERLLGALGLKWDDTSAIDRRAFERRRVRALRRDAIGYLTRTFASTPLWGFKDPRTIRVLPFWQRALREWEVEDSYVVAIRNPRSVAASLYARQATDADAAYRLWLAHMVPFFNDIIGKPFVVVDYDLLMRDPGAQLARIAHRLGVPFEASSVAIDVFVSGFLDPSLRHSVFEPDDFDDGSPVARLTRDAYLRLYELAADRENGPESSLPGDWGEFQARLNLILEPQPRRRFWPFQPRQPVKKERK